MALELAYVMLSQCCLLKKSHLSRQLFVAVVMKIFYCCLGIVLFKLMPPRLLKLFLYDNRILCVSRHLAELTRPVTQTTHNSVWHICSQHMLLRMVFLA